VAQLDRLLGTLLTWPQESIDVERLRGIEGAGASAYFGGFTQLFAPALEFTARNRRPPRDPVNACLSLGYTLLHFEAVTACHGAGLAPFIGFYHEPAYGRESLACDLVEPLRPRVDEWAWELFSSKTLRSDHFTSEQQNGCLLDKTGRKLFYAEYERFIPPLRKLLRRFAGSSARRLIADQEQAG
jgi:CRISP-associated protein Cas1